MDVKPTLPPIARWHALQFLGVAIALAFVASLALQPWFSPRLLMLVSWDVGALCYLGFGWFVIARTTLGFRIRVTGENPEAARYGGINVQRVLLSTALLSGALAGLAGVGEVGGVHFQVMSDISPGYGYSGIVVAMQDERSQLQNRAKAMQILAARLAQRQREEHRKEMEALSGEKRDVAAIVDAQRATRAATRQRAEIDRGALTPEDSAHTARPH